MSIQDSISKAVDLVNEQINALAYVATTKDYMESLNKQQIGTYLVRPDGSIEFIK